MDYTTYFQTTLDKYQRAARRRRDRARTHHTRILNLLTPLLDGLDRTLAGQRYRDSRADGPLTPYRHGDPGDLNRVFGLECSGRAILKIELRPTAVEVKNGIKGETWRLADFDAGSVQQIARLVAETIIPHVVATKEASGTPPAHLPSPVLADGVRSTQVPGGPNAHFRKEINRR